jgi:hypothetical protein
MTDLSKRLREASIHRETVTPDEHGMRVLLASLDRAKGLMAEAADAAASLTFLVGGSYLPSLGFFFAAMAFLCVPRMSRQPDTSAPSPE